MILALGISIHTQSYIGDKYKYEFDNRYWNLIGMQWDTINDTWEEEI
tara:strand:- start:559 stop:699 length:141 start_codon:yes stop_codon:yes gene_type:complete